MSKLENGSVFTRNLLKDGIQASISATQSAFFTPFFNGSSSALVQKRRDVCFLLWFPIRKWCSHYMPAT